jgi:hypothetical protein
MLAMRYSLKALFALTFFAALLSVAFFVLSETAFVWATYLVSLMMPAAVVAGIVYARGAWRAFFIGCASYAVAIGLACVYAAFGPGLLEEARDLGLSDWLGSVDDANVVKIGVALNASFWVASGLTAVFVRWLVRLRPGKPIDPPLCAKTATPPP